MTQTLEPVNLDNPPDQPPAARPRWSWVLGGVTAFVLLLTLIPSPGSVVAVASLATREPTIQSTQSDGWGEGMTVVRNDAGVMIAVMTAVRPFGEEGAWCRLVVDGQAVEVHSDGGHPAICMWARGAQQ